jgi:hypothetical protein
MTKQIIYQTDAGGVAIVIPTLEALQEHTIKEIADKDVPAGKPYKIIEWTDLPSDFTFRDAWEVDVSILTDGVGSESHEFTVKKVTE